MKHASRRLCAWLISDVRQKDGADLHAVNNEQRGAFSLEDIRTIRYLVLVMGGIGVFMLLVTDRETPIIVVSFIAVVTVVPPGAIYLIRHLSRRKRPNKSPEPTPGSVTPRAKE